VRFAATVLLWVAITAATAVAILTAWAQLNIVDADGYAALARRAATDPTLQSAAASELATQATAFISGRGRSVDPAIVGGAAATYTASPAFPEQFAQVNRLVHGWVLNGDSSGDAWVVDIAPMLKDPSLQQVLSRFHARTPATLVVPLTASPPTSLSASRLRIFATWNLWVCLGTGALAALSAVLTLAAARSRAKALTGLGVSALVVGACGWAVLEVARQRVEAALDDTTGDIRAIADVMVGHAEAGLHHWLDLTLAAGGALVACSVLVAVLRGWRDSY
jgi:hypothetical protein